MKSPYLYIKLRDEGNVSKVGDVVTHHSCSAYIDDGTQVSFLLARLLLRRQE